MLVYRLTSSALILTDSKHITNTEKTQNILFNYTPHHHKKTNK